MADGVGAVGSSSVDPAVYAMKKADQVQKEAVETLVKKTEVTQQAKSGNGVDIFA